MLRGTFRAKKNSNFVYRHTFGADFTGSTFLMEIRTKAGALAATLSTENDGLTLTVEGTKSHLDYFLMTDDQPDAGTYDYDVLRIDGSGSTYLVGGEYIVYPGVTVPP